jgi:hypothetical protein
MWRFAERIHLDQRDTKSHDTVSIGHKDAYWLEDCQRVVPDAY